MRGTLSALPDRYTHLVNMARYHLLVKALAVTSLPLVLAQRSALQPSPNSTCDYAHPPPDLDCSSPVSNDYYGEGVRIGIYLTWFTSWVANSFVEEEIAGALDANTIFLMAVLISMLKATARSELAYIDGLILMQLSAGFLFGCLSLWGYRTVWYYKQGPAAIRHFGGFGTHARLLLMFGISVYGIWFWVEGIQDGLIIVTDENGNERPCQCYPLRTFFFVKLLVPGGIRYFYIVMSTGTAVYFGIMLLIALLERLLHFFQVRDPELLWHRGQYTTGFSQSEYVIRGHALCRAKLIDAPRLKWIFRIIHFGNLVWMVFSILTVSTLQVLTLAQSFGRDPP